MNNQNSHIFSLYKPFRNQIRKYNLLDSLYVIWGYSRNFTFNLPFPHDIEQPNGFNPDDDINTRRDYGLQEFEQEFLLKEFVLNCNTKPTKDSLKRKANLSKLINYLRFSFSDEIEKQIINSQDILLEFNRMAHRQFKWQLNYNKNVIFRYYKVYSDTKINSIIRNKLNLTTHELFVIGLFLFRLTAQNFRESLHFKSEIPSLTNEMFKVFFQNFSMPIEKARDELKNHYQMNENIFYSYNPLLAKPILIYQDTFLCPIPLFLFWQITGGVYYSIVKEKGFENAFGNSFQNYIGEILYKCCTNPHLKILHEKKYGKVEKRTTDWIIYDDNAVLFLECKTKRMTLPSKTEIDIRIGLEDDLKKMASFITQLYKTYLDYSKGKYPQLSFDSTKKFVPLVVTLEEWYININPNIMKILRDLVIDNLRAKSIDISIIDKYPYYIRSSDSFEKDIQLINSLGILAYFDRIEKKELHDFIQNYVFHNPFEGEFEETFLIPLR